MTQHSPTPAATRVLTLVPAPAPEPAPKSAGESAAEPDADLQLLTVHELWGTPTVRHHAAAEQRAHAFHEAAHLWAADRASLAPRSGSATEDGPTFTAADDETTTWIAASGFFAQGLMLEADEFRREQQMPADEILNLIELDDFIKPADVTDCIASMRQYCCCRRGGDERALHLLRDERWVASHLDSVLEGWMWIDSLAYALLTNTRLDEAAIRRALT